MLDAHFALQDQKLLGDLSQLEVFVNGSFCRAEAVSYTLLTLPTSDLV